jgi:two-component system cell cycle response regulator
MTPHDTAATAAPTDGGAGGGSGEGAGAGSSPSAGRVLVVDDHEDNVELLKVRLESWGYLVDTARDGMSALQAVENSPPDLILLDVMMPTVDGNEVARRIKQNPSLPFIPIIMQTALDSTESKVEGLEAGADDYITKPIEFAELKARVRSMMRIKKLQEDLEERERQLLEANERLRHMSRTDSLTGLDNRRYLEQQVDQMFAHAERLSEPLSCVMCDLDRFKSVNDEFGHHAGDVVLKHFARILKHEAREIDRVGRYGGEEFVILLPGTVLDAAVTFAERVRKEVENHTFVFDGGSVHRTASFGVAGWPHPRVQGCDQLIRAADDAMYVAKETGRNRVVRFDGDEFNAHTAADDGARNGEAAIGYVGGTGDRSGGELDIGREDVRRAD